ncbi:MAG: YfcC family protein [Bacilli bacterium]|nr:YfcC family protein [Bacilli bacterium]
MEKSNSIQTKAFVSAIIILFFLLVMTGVLTYIIPSGIYQYQFIDGIKTVVPDSFSYTNADKLPIYRIFTAPIEVLFSDGNTIVIAIILFLLIIGGSIKVLNQIGVIEYLIFIIIQRFKDKRYLLLSLITLIFMSIGAFIGVFEEIIPLVPIMIILSKKLGWDTKIGLGMSVLATGFGFSAAVTNPFTIGVAQQLAELPLFSGFGFRFIIFIVIYFVLIGFLIISAKRIDHGISDDITIESHRIPTKMSLIWFFMLFGMMILSILISPFISFFQDYNLILIAVYFLIAGIGSGLFSTLKSKEVFKTYLKGSLDLAPGIILILLATGVKHLITTGEIIDTILFNVMNTMSDKPSFIAVLGAFFFTLFANFFIGSGSAKAFIIIPLLNPLLDMTGISRQLGVLAFQLGDGFSNLFYPTNAVLLVALGLASFSYPKWFKWTVLLQIIIIILSIIFLYVGFKVGY